MSPLELWLVVWLWATSPPGSHLVFGAGGGLLYLARQKLKRYKIHPTEFWARPVFGAVGALVLTVLLGLPNHVTSLFVGYFGVDVWDAMAKKFEGRFNYQHDEDD